MKKGHDIAVVAPAGVPKDVIVKLNRTLVASVEEHEVYKTLLAQGADPVGSTPEELAAFMRDEAAKWGRVIRASGARAE